MSKRILAGLAIAFTCGAAHAADLPARGPSYKAPAPSVYDWSGFYAGGYVGYGWAKTQATDLPDYSGVPWYQIGGRFSTSPSSFNGGGQAGYNYQFGSWMAGVEGDIGSLRLKGTGLYNAGDLDTFITTNGSYIATLRGRFGFASGVNLFYVTGGAAWGDFNSQVVSFSNFISPPTGTQAGWTLGGGWEYAFANQWSVKAEYLHYDMGSKTVMLANTSSAFSIKNTGDLVRLGVNFHFGR